MSKENQSAAKKPVIYTDPNTGKKRIRMEPVKQKVVDTEKDDRKVTSEAVDMTRMKQLASSGLVDRAAVSKLMIALKKMNAGKTLTPAEKDMIVKVMADLTMIVTGDTTTFNKAKKAVKEAVEDDEPASPDEAGMAMAQLKFIKYASEEIANYIQKNAGFPEWFQNKLTKAHEGMKDLHSYMEGENNDA